MEITSTYLPGWMVRPCVVRTISRLVARVHGAAGCVCMMDGLSRAIHSRYRGARMGQKLTTRREAGRCKVSDTPICAEHAHQAVFFGPRTMVVAVEHVARLERELAAARRVLESLYYDHPAGLSGSTSCAYEAAKIYLNKSAIKQTAGGGG